MDELNGASERGQTPEMETTRTCEQILMRLKPLQRQVIELTYFEGWTAQQIADLQHRAVTHVRNDRYRAIAKLRVSASVPTRQDKRRRALPQLLLMIRQDRLEGQLIAGHTERILKSELIEYALKRFQDELQKRLGIFSNRL